MKNDWDEAEEVFSWYARALWSRWLERESGIFVQNTVFAPVPSN